MYLIMERASHDTPSAPANPSHLLGEVDVHDLRMLGWRLELYNDLASDPSISHDELLELNDHIDNLPEAVKEHYSKYIDAFTAAMDAKLELPDIFEEIETTLEAQIIIRAHQKGRSIRVEGLLRRLFSDRPSLEDRNLLEETLQRLVSKGLLVKSKRLSYYLHGAYEAGPDVDSQSADLQQVYAAEAQPASKESIDQKIKRAFGKKALKGPATMLPGHSLNNKDRRSG